MSVGFFGRGSKGQVIVTLASGRYVKAVAAW